MKAQHLRWCSLVLGLILLVSLLGCSVSVTPTPSPSATPLSATFEAPPSSSDTPLQDTSIPSPHPEIPTQTPLPTRPSKALTPISVPTLTASEEQELVLSLLQDNGGCQLPCWWGFTPGETTWQTAQEFFAALGKSPAAYHDPRGTVNYTVRLQVPQQISQSGDVAQHYIVRDDIIEMIWVVVGYSQSYALPQLLATYGQPKGIWLRTFAAVADTDGGELPFFLLLYYQQQRFLARYVGFTYEQDGQIPMCPQQASGALWLWSSGREMTLEDIAHVGVGGFPIDEVPDYRLLEEATNWSIEQFYQTFVQPDNQTCLETPADLW